MLPDPADTLEISPQELAALIPEDVAVAPFPLIDCREADEFQICQLPGARLVPLAEIPERFPPPDPDRGDIPIVVY